MAYSEFKLALSDEELGLPALLDLCDKYKDWCRLSKEQEGGRKTRSANKKADKLYEEIMNYTLPPLKIKSLAQNHNTNDKYSNESRDVSMDSISSDTGVDSSSSSRPMTRSLRPRCRTPSPASSGGASRSAVPSTPQNQRLRARLRPQQPSSGSATSGSSNALVASGQHHPSVSATKIRQLLRADSAQKKRQEERERQERIRLERKVKEERAEAQKKQLLEERAITAKQKREQRLLHAAEVRKAREQAKNQRTKYEHEHQAHHHEQSHHQQQSSKPVQAPPQPQQAAPAQAQPAATVHKPEQPQQVVEKPNDTQMKKPAEPAVLNETFKKNEINNIEIVIHDTSNSVKGDAPVIAAWARAPNLRKALVEQYTNPSLQPDIKATHLMPVDLERILGKSVGARHLKRTSSAVWTPPRKSIMRSHSNVSTPTR